MVPDFLTFYKICIEYKDDDGEHQLFEHNLDNTTNENYFHIDDRDYNTERKIDYIDRCEEQRRYQIYKALAKIPNISVFKNGLWLCDEYKKVNYQTLIQQNEIPQKSVVAIWKQADYYII